MLSYSNGWAYTHRLVLWKRIGPGAHECRWCGCTSSWQAPKLPRYIYVTSIDGRYYASFQATFDVRGVELSTDHLDGKKRNNRASNLEPACIPCNTERERSGNPKEFGRVTREWLIREAKEMIKRVEPAYAQVWRVRVSRAFKGLLLWGLQASKRPSYQDVAPSVGTFRRSINEAAPDPPTEESLLNASYRTSPLRLCEALPILRSVTTKQQSREPQLQRQRASEPPGLPKSARRAGVDLRLHRRGAAHWPRPKRAKPTEADTTRARRYALLLLIGEKPRSGARLPLTSDPSEPTGSTDKEDA